MTSHDPVLRIAAWLPLSRVNGPGARGVLWVQGCSRRCDGCCNPEFQSAEGGRRMKVSDVFSLILAAPGIEGVTYSGGEPFEQAGALALLSRLCREAGFAVMAYSGLTYEALRSRNDSAAQALLRELDVLVDGPFQAACAAPLLWRGSRNQRVHFLTDRYRAYADEVNGESAELEIRLAGDTLTVTGTAPDDLVRSLFRTSKRGG